MRIGRFDVSASYLIGKSEEFKKITDLLELNPKDFVVKYDVMTETLRYTATSPYFDDLEPGKPIPLYTIYINRTADGEITIEDVVK